MALTVVLRDGEVEIPIQAQRNLLAFRQWVKSDPRLQKTRTDFYKGEVWIDMGTEQVFTHGAVKSAIAVVLYQLANVPDGDLFLINGILLSNTRAQLSCNPDMTFVRAATLDSGRVKLIEAADEGFIELEGSPDMVLEIVSPSSVRKDTITLRKAYWKSGVSEYWLVNALGDRAELVIYRRGPKGYSEGRKTGDWSKSSLFGKSFRLKRSPDRRGNPTFQLETK